MNGSTDRPPSSSCLTWSQSGAVGRLILDRPEKLNALSAELLHELVEVCAWLNSRDDVRVVVVSGRGRAFSAGFDLGEFTRAAAPARMDGPFIPARPVEPLLRTAPARQADPMAEAAMINAGKQPAPKPRSTTSNLFRKITGLGLRSAPTAAPAADRKSTRLNSSHRT